MRVQITIIQYSLILFILAAGAISIDSKEHFSAVGNHFLSINENYAPKIIPLYDKTQIYIDINSDGVSDFQYTQDSNKTLAIDTPWPIKPGSIIKTSKPVIYQQDTKQDSIYRVSNYVPPVTNFKKEYVTAGGLYTILSTEDTTIEIYHLINESTTYRDIKAYEPLKINLGQTYLESNDPFIAYHEKSFAMPVGRNYIASNSTVYIVSKDNYEVEIDYNDDQIFDDTFDYDSGLSTITVPIGAYLEFSRDVGVYKQIRGNSYVAINPIFPFNYLSSEGYFFRLGTDPTKIFTFGFYNESQFYYNGTDIDLYQTDKLELKPFGLTYFESDAPTLVAADYGSHYSYRSCGACNTVYVHIVHANPMQASAQISLVSFPKKKYLKTNGMFDSSIRVFNTFKDTVANNFKLEIRLNNQFLTLQTYSVIIEKKDSIDDEIISSKSFILTPVSSRLNIDDSFLSTLGPQEYFDVTLTLLSPAQIGIYKVLDVDLDYSIPVWNYD